MTSSSHIYNVLIAESFSCQRDLILNLKQADFSSQLKIFTCHSTHRAEILTVADHILAPMPKGEPAVAWLLEQCQIHRIHLLFIGKNGGRFEAHRQQFEQYGITLITGTLSLENHQLIDDKYTFTQYCLAQNLPAIPAYQFANVEQFLQCYAQAEQQHPAYILCAKPVYGVFAHGFIQFKANADFHGLFRIPIELTIDDFCQQYARLTQPPHYILMPYLTGQECSVDIACHQGEIISLATRIKENYRQKIYLNADCDVLCHQLVKLFQLDGLINIQFKQDHAGKWHILEINARPAGGFSYSIHTGRNLIADLIAKKLTLNSHISSIVQEQLYVYPFTSSLSEHP